MNKRHVLVRFSVCFVALGLPLRPQHQRQDRISANMEKLVVTLKTDRVEYFPGELGQLTITVQNPTRRDLEITQPFVNESVVLLQKGNVSARAYGLEYGRVSPEPYVIPVRTSLEKLQPPPTMVIRAGEQLVKTMQFFDKGMGNSPEAELFFTGSAPSWSGDFRVEYPSQSTDFRVVMPVFEGFVKIDLPDYEEVPRIGAPPMKAKLRAYAFVLGYGGKHFICIERLPHLQDIGAVNTDQQKRVVDRGLPFSRYSRFAESDEPIGSLRGESNGAGEVILSWTQSGAERHLTLARTDWQIVNPRLGK